MANSGEQVGQFSDDAQYGDKFTSPGGTGRKRSMGEEFSGGDLDQGYQKRGRFEEGPGPGSGEELSVPPATLRVLVRQMDAGGIIGKGGENIKRLRKVHDCQVVLPDSPGAPERVMTMMGSIDGCVGVLVDCLPKLGDGPVQLHGDPNTLAFETQVLIPQPFMGTIIGTGGTKIKELRSKTQTSIKIFSEPMPNSNERSVQLIGTVEQITQCLEYFLDEISKKEPREPIYLYEPTTEGDMYSGPPPGDFQGPPRRGNFRGGGGGRGLRGGGGWRGGRGDRGRGRGSFQGGSWGGNRGGPGRNSYQQSPNPTPPMGTSGYSASAPPHLTSGNTTSYGGGQTNVGYSSMPHQPSSTNVGQATGMYMPPAAPAPMAPPTTQLMPPSGQQTQQVTIPNEYAASILGVNGANLDHIRSQSSCDIMITDPKPGSTERIINITGTSSNIQLAQSLMQNSVRQYHSV